MRAREIIKLQLVLWLLLFAAFGANGQNIDLLKRYPTQLTDGDLTPERARTWEFTGGDVFRVSRFSLEVGKDLRIETGAADLGIGRSSDGAVWALVVPREGGKLSSGVAKEEGMAHVWLRFHPKEIRKLFPADTVFADGATNLVLQMQTIARQKMNSSYQAGGQAMIPPPKDMTVDVDLTSGVRRFFIVDTTAATATYEGAFEKRAVRLPGPIAPADAQAAFDKLWQSFDRQYAGFALRPEVDWTRLREEYRPKAIASKSSYEFASICAEMLRPLHDLHVWLTLAGSDVPVFNRPRAANSNPTAHQAILGGLNRAGRNVQWAVTPDKIGFIAIYGWDDSATPAQCHAALEKMRDTRGLIVDVRLNGGGSEDLAMEVAGRFLKKEFTYAFNQYRNGPSHTNLTEKLARKVAPHGPWRYDRPVVVLIGEKCMSSNESFIAMMSGDPDATIMGDHTCGSSGNPQMVNLPLKMTVSVPQWIDYLPDGTPLDERGFQPQIKFAPQPGAFEGKRDDLLSAALERLQRMELPPKPIAGDPYMSEEVVEASDDTRPKVVSVTPEDGATAVEPLTELRIRFDRPMDPLSVKLDWKSGGCVACDRPKYDGGKHEFIFPIHLTAGTAHQIVVNGPLTGNLQADRKNRPRDGFTSADHRLARLFTWGFRTKEEPPLAEARPVKVVKISPPPGSAVAYRTFVEVQFDQPMKPPGEALPYVPGNAALISVLEGIVLVPFLEYDASSCTFRLPMILPLKTNVSFTLAGFVTAAGVEAAPVKIQYRTSDEELSPTDRDRLDAAKKNPKLLETLEWMRQKRSQLTSLSERVHTFGLMGNDGVMTRLGAASASFHWEQKGRFRGDASQMMMTCSDFEIGSDGQNWWWQVESAWTANFVTCPVAEMQQLYVSVCDPFELTRKGPAAAADELGLMYLGPGKLAGADCHRIGAWHIEKEALWMSSFTEWWVDAESGFPVEIRHSNRPEGTRFYYDAVNQPLAAELFAVPRPKDRVASPPEPLDAGYTRRFINFRDGSDDRISLRWGKEGPKGRSSSGLN